MSVYSFSVPDKDEFQKLRAWLDGFSGSERSHAIRVALLRNLEKGAEVDESNKIIQEIREIKAMLQQGVVMLHPEDLSDVEDPELAGNLDDLMDNLG